MPCSQHPLSPGPLREDRSWCLPLKPCLMSTYPLPLLLPCSAFFATILVITERTAQNTNVPTASRWLQDIHHICVCGPNAPFASVGAIPIRLAPSRSVLARPDINGVSVLETMWVAVHSRTIREHMADVEEPSLDNLRKAGMFMICLGDVHRSRVLAPESEAILE